MTAGISILLASNLKFDLPVFRPRTRYGSSNKKPIPRSLGIQAGPSRSNIPVDLVLSLSSGLNLVSWLSKSENDR